QISSALGTSTPDFTISTRSGESFSIDIGAIYDNDGALQSPPVTDLAGVIQRINAQTAGKVTAAINPAGTGLRLTDNTAGGATFSVADIADRSTAADLGIAGDGSPAGILDGRRLIAGLNSVLARNLRGGNGIEPGLFEIVARDGSYHAFAANFSGSVTDFINSVSTATGGKITLALNASGTGFDLTDNTNGSGPLTVAGTAASDLGLAVSAAAVSSVRGGRAQMKYIGLATRVADLNNGRGIGTGRFEITNSYGERRVIDIGTDTATIDDLVREINSGGPGYAARINNNGDGIIIEEVVRNGVPGGNKIAIRDLTGTVAKSLNLVGTASGTGASNFLDGSYERTVALAVGDTLTQVAEKINQAGVYAAASVVNDGSPSRHVRLTLTGRDVGEGGRFTIDAAGADLGLTTLSAGNNSRVFFGAADPASAILFSTSGNSVTGVLSNVTIDLKSPRSEPVTLTVTRDNQAVEDAVSEFVAAFNQVISRIDAQSTFDADANKRGTLLGDSTTQSLRSVLLSTVQGPPLGVSGRYQSLTQVGVTVGRNGQLQVDSDKLRAAIANDPQAVKDLFVAKAQVPATAGQPVIGPDGQPIPGVTLVGGSSAQQAAFTSLGIMERIGQLTDQYINTTTGTLTRRSRSLDTQIKSQNDLIASLDKKLESRRAILERQFVRMEQAIGQLQGQQGALGSIRSITR
ncbi:MAG: flagellar filament capping protein FliD, partial [Phycisphaerae bacterium]|nr:flagellar filament capping protein FliD [Phycisphaerae bacterium]